jgi:protein TonB
MPLRCLLFATDEGMVQPIWQVLADLGIEGELCQSAVDAVEKVTTQLFQIVVTDWEDQPEASFLLKTARDQRAATRPLTLAIVGDESRLPEALRAGANSVLLKPLRPEQVRETLKTACELIRAKQAGSSQQPAPLRPATTVTEEPAAKAFSAAAAGRGSNASSLNESLLPGEMEKNFRAGEFLQTPRSAPGAEFDTESDIQKSIHETEAAAVEHDALSELEPMAAVVSEAIPAKPAGDREALTGWAALQNRLTRPGPQTAFNAETAPEMPPGVEDPFQSPVPTPGLKPKPADLRAEADLQAYISGEQKDEVRASAASGGSPRRRILIFGAIGLTVTALVAIPGTRHKLQVADRRAASAAIGWLNPKPVPLPQVAAQHDSFGQEGDEYKFPVAGNIPDATTDPSQIQVVPVVDPTVKTKTSDAEVRPATGGNVVPDQGTATTNSKGDLQTGSVAGGAAPGDQSASLTTTAGAPQVNSPPVQTQISLPPSAPASAPLATSPSASVSTQSAPAVPSQPKPAMVRSAASPGGISIASTAPIPSSLRSQVASMTPEASGSKPVEAAMSSFEPVALSEASVRNLLAQGDDPQYPAGAKTNGQSGSVTLQVLIAHDGTVQDAKFLQGSLMFANTAIEAVKLWRFKPYLLNGRPVSVQSTITLNFKPPA